MSKEIWYTCRVDSRFQNLFEWLESMSGTRKIKVLSGIRGVGKSTLLHQWCARLLERGVRDDRIIYVNAEEPALRHVRTGEDFIAYLKTQLPGGEQPCILFVDEPSSFPDYESGFGELLRRRNIDIYVSISSRRLLNEGLADYLNGAVAMREIVPPPEGIAEPEDRSRARWNEILLRDVLSDPHLTSAPLAEDIAAYLSDHVGDPISLRTIAAEVSPPGRMISPNTAGAYLTALCNAHIVEKCLRWNAGADEPMKTGYRVFFADMSLRTACFGPAPTNEDARAAMNGRWLAARNQAEYVVLPELVTFDSAFMRR